MKAWLLLAFFAVSLTSAVAGDPPGYPRVLIGRVSNVVPEGIVIDVVKDSQIFPIPSLIPPGGITVCEIGSGTSIFLRGLRTSHRKGDKIAIMVTASDAIFDLKIDAQHIQQYATCDLLSETIKLPIAVDWDATGDFSKATPLVPVPASAAPTPAPTPAAAKSTVPADFNPGSLDDPIPGTQK